jgi:hypothetical protein
VSDETRNAEVRLSADVEPYRQSVQGAAQDTSSLATAIDNVATKLDGLQRRVGKKLTLFAAADLAVMGGMVAVTADWAESVSSCFS